MAAEAIALIVGLGNPGKAYEETRHNVGFRVVDRLAWRAGIVFQERKFQASWGSGVIAGQRVILFKPLTYMNRSGEAVGEVLRYFAIPPDRMLVVHDDLDLPCGRLRLVRRGGAGGHRGVASIIEQLHGQDFPRLKLGIGRPEHREAVEAFVLHLPYPEQVGLVEAMIDSGGEAAEMILASGLSSAMDRFNRKDFTPGESPREG